MKGNKISIMCCNETVYGVKSAWEAKRGHIYRFDCKKCGKIILGTEKEAKEIAKEAVKND